MTYTQVWDHMKGQPHDSIIQRDEDGAFIPMDPDNIDCQEYMAWLDEGNEPTAAVAPDTYPEGNLEVTVVKSGGGAFPMDGPIKRTKT
jgi:hypothetical protein